MVVRALAERVGEGVAGVPAFVGVPSLERCAFGVDDAGAYRNPAI
jgi:hypothetical protein